MARLARFQTTQPANHPDYEPVDYEPKRLSDEELLAGKVGFSEKQHEAWRLLHGPQRHTCGVGGSRAGKTVLFTWITIARALKAKESRHAILRLNANAVWPSVGLETFPAVMSRYFPRIVYNSNLRWGYFELECNGSQIWLGGLDDKERVEKILGREYCLDLNSKVLTADLEWVRVQDLKRGQELIAFPEGLDGHQRLVRSKVTRTSIIQARRFRVVTTRGDTIVSEGHSFVSYEDDRRHKNFRSLSWRKARDLSVGNKIRFACAPWETDRSYDGGWFAGMLDGEGWVSGGGVGVAQNPGPLLNRLAEAFLERGIVVNGNNHTGKCCANLKCKSLWDSLKILGMVRPLRLMKKASTVWEGRRGFTTKGARANHGTGKPAREDATHVATVLRVEDLGFGPVVALGTSTKTLIADGFLGHNSSMYFNECSQIPFASVDLALSRLAQNIPGLRQRALYDLNPVGKGHWTNIQFGEHLDPKTRKRLPDPENYVRFFLNPIDNKANLTKEYMASLANATGKTRARFYEGIYTDETESALWSFELIDRGRLDPSKDKLPSMQRIVISIDPSGAKSSDERLGNDMIGIIAVGLGVDGDAYVLEDGSRLDGPVGWVSAAINLFDKYNADRIVAEVNFGGAMVEALLRTQRAKIPFKAVTASRGKVVRAEPCAALYGDPKAQPTDQNFKSKVHHYGRFDALENQMTEFTDYGFMGEGSPDRVDSLVWGLTELMLAPSARPYLDFLEEDVARAQGKALPHKLGLSKAPTDRKAMFAQKPHMNFAPTKEHRYVSADDCSLHEVTLGGMLDGVQPDHAEALRKQGCTDAEI